MQTIGMAQHALGFHRLFILAATGAKIRIKRRLDKTKDRGGGKRNLVLGCNGFFSRDYVIRQKGAGSWPNGNEKPTMFRGGAASGEEKNVREMCGTLLAEVTEDTRIWGRNHNSVKRRNGD